LRWGRHARIIQEGREQGQRINRDC
jgi:hypothetical protein